MRKTTERGICRSFPSRTSVNCITVLEPPVTFAGPLGDDLLSHIRNNQRSAGDIWAVCGSSGPLQGSRDGQSPKWCAGAPTRHVGEALVQIVSAGTVRGQTVIILQYLCSNRAKPPARGMDAVSRDPLYVFSARRGRPIRRVALKMAKNARRATGSWGMATYLARCIVVI